MLRFFAQGFLTIEAIMSGGWTSAARFSISVVNLNQTATPSHVVSTLEKQSAFGMS